MAKRKNGAKKLNYEPEYAPEGWPKWRSTSAQAQLEEDDELARAVWEIYRAQHNRFRNKLILHGETPVDEHWPAWQHAPDRVRNSWRAKTKAMMRGKIQPAEDDKELVQRVAAAIYNLNPWCRPEKLPSGSVIVTEVPWDSVGWPSEVGQDVRRRAELYARTAISVIRENDAK